MAFYRFTRLQQYINGQPTDIYSKGERVDDVDYSTYDDCMGGTADTRWIPISQTVCHNGDLWSMEKEQISYDEGATWTDTGNTKRASVIEQSSSQCSGANNDWRVVYGEYICNGTTKCIKEAEYVNDSPTGRTRAGSMVELLSEDCGVMYQWVDVPGEFICVYKCGRADKYTKQKQQYSLDNGVHWEDTGETREGDFIEKNSADCGCDTSITRWITVSGKYVCVGTSKYTKEKEQSSTDGTNWTDTGNTRAGSLIETSSTDCASIRWVTVQDEYSCVGYNKYNKEKEQQSMDGGTTWTDTGNTRAGSTLIEADSTDCGYDPHDYSTKYLTTEALGSGDICLAKMNATSDDCIEPIEDIQYSKNNGTWFLYTYGTKISVVTGDKIRWKGTIKDGNHYHYYSVFHPTADYKVYGNPLSLLKNDRFVDEPDAIYEDAYYHLFYGNGTLKDASGLALPATTMAKFCYYGMFQGCTKLTTGPALPATTLADFCYAHMYEECRNLNHVICLATNKSASDCTTDWLYKVSSTGTFTKAAGATWSRGTSGIPSGWTVQDA